MKDFTLEIYRTLLESLLNNGYTFISYADYCKSIRPDKFIILRHDVDKKPENSLRTAQIESSIGAKATYYFRVGKESNEPDIIRAIARLGHEIGYHYEDLSLCNGDFESAYNHFVTWLDYFRQYYAVETVCMHGAPTSRYDGKDLWLKYDYRSLDIIGEPYFDTDFSDVFYLTDTGRCWDGYKVSVRDKIPDFQEKWLGQGLAFHSTEQIIDAIENNKLPAHVMITTHPQRWTNNRREWVSELVVQKCKNLIKRALISARKK